MSDEKRKEDVTGEVTARAQTKAQPKQAGRAAQPQEKTKIVNPSLQAGTENLRANDTELKDEAPASSFVDTIYAQINSVLGGDNSNQFLCLTIPGQALTAEDYAYDYKNNAAKGPTVEANESRLANKLFDPCHITGGDNGLTLPYQYKTAIDMLTPKLNEKIALAKHELRQLLMTEYPYDFGDGKDKVYTLQEVFFRLYDEYVSETKNWAEVQNKKKEELRQKYPGGDEKSNEAYNDEYLSWYETAADTYLNGINEKMSKVISVFTPNDMKILEGILDSGSGAELQEARRILNNTKKLTPDGGSVYPVKLYPTNWFELLDTSFTPIDLLDSPSVLSDKLQRLSSRRLTLQSRISEVTNLVPADEKIQKLQKTFEEKKDAVDKAQQEVIKNYGEGIQTVLDAVFDIAPLFSNGAVPAEIIAGLASNIKLSNEKTIKELIADLTTVLQENTKVQQEYVKATQDLADASLELVKTKGLSNLKEIISPMKAQLEELNLEIQDLQTKIQLSSVTRPAADENGVVKDSDTSKNAVAPSTVPEGYTQIIITAEAQSMTKGTESIADASVSTSGVSFLFGGYQHKEDSASSSINSSLENSDMEVQIGMNVAKVGIEREWFNPGIFALTKDMFNVTTTKISPNPDQPYADMSDIRLKAMKNTIFPCYPVAMVLARDVSVKLVSENSISSEFSSEIQKHASSGGGFLFFSGSKSNSSNSSSSGVHATSTSNTVTLRFDTPQIIGYYLQATPADQSVYLDDVSGDSQAGFVTISKFVEDYKKILEAMNKKKHQDEGTSDGQ